MSRLSLFILALAFVAPGSLAQNTGLPESWLGTWEGTMINHMVGSEGGTIPVRMEIALLETGAYVWRTVYNNDEEMGLRDYRMIPVTDEPGQFINDEQNGILLRTSLIGGELRSAFEVGPQNLISNYRLDGDTLIQEVTFWTSDDVKTTTGSGLGGENGQPVHSYRIAGVQCSEARCIGSSSADMRAA